MMRIGKGYTLKIWAIVISIALLFTGVVYPEDTLRLPMNTRQTLERINKAMEPRFYNRSALKQAVKMVIDRSSMEKPLLMVIDGDSRTGKTVLGEDIKLLLSPYVRVKVVPIDNYHKIEDSLNLPGEYWEYVEQFGPPRKHKFRE